MKSTSMQGLNEAPKRLEPNYKIVHVVGYALITILAIACILVSRGTITAIKKLNTIKQIQTTQESVQTTDEKPELDSFDYDGWLDHVKSNAANLCVTQSTFADTPYSAEIGDQIMDNMDTSGYVPPMWFSSIVPVTWSYGLANIDIHDLRADVIFTCKNEAGDVFALATGTFDSNGSLYALKVFNLPDAYDYMQYDGYADDVINGTVKLPEQSANTDTDSDTEASDAEAESSANEDFAKKVLDQAAEIQALEGGSSDDRTETEAD